MFDVGFLCTGTDLLLRGLHVTRFLARASLFVVFR